MLTLSYLQTALLWRTQEGEGLVGKRKACVEHFWLKEGEGLLLIHRRSLTTCSMKWRICSGLWSQSGGNSGFTLLSCSREQDERVLVFGATAASVCACFNYHQKAGNLLRGRAAPSPYCFFCFCSSLHCGSRVSSLFPSCIVDSKNSTREMCGSFRCDGWRPSVDLHWPPAAQFECHRWRLVRAAPFSLLGRKCRRRGLEEAGANKLQSLWRLLPSLCVSALNWDKCVFAGLGWWAGAICRSVGRCVSVGPRASGPA